MFGMKPVSQPRTELEPAFRLDLGEYVTCAAVASDGLLAAVGLGNGELVLVDLGTGGVVSRRAAHDGGVLSVSFAPDGRGFVTSGQDAEARLWDRSGAPVRRLPGGGKGWVEHAVWSPRGDRIATASGKVVRLWTPTGDPMFETEPLASTVTGLSFREDGSGLAASTYGGVHLLPMVDGATPKHFVWKGSLVSVALSPDGKIVACASQDNSVHFWRVATGRDSEMTGYPFKPKSLAWDRESKLLATSGDSRITIWDFRGKGPEGTKPIQLAAHKGVVTTLAFSPDSGHLASGSEDMSVLVWEPRRGARPLRFAFLEDQITTLSFVRGSLRVCVGDAQGTFALFATKL